ncbi:hypothetical protein [Kitasatospora sp. NPDC093679]|uniref:hypothetical protein n=1 Tax=Kitasatospora sp. NPDC093679 TaxID=3154983 RepID=UPI0034163802
MFGQQARAVLEGDTVFLSAFPDGWKITAAGCEPRPEMPYRCDVKGGLTVRVLFTLCVVVVVGGLAYFTTIGLLQR